MEGGDKGMLAPPPKLFGGGGGLATPGPPSSYAYVSVTVKKGIVLHMCICGNAHTFEYLYTVLHVLIYA